MLNKEIVLLKNEFVNAFNLIKIYLFSSYVYGTLNKESDFDFYIVVDNSNNNLIFDTAKAYKVTRAIKTRPVDIILNTNS